jgi:glycolate oxidase iron-sulfur subunit
VLRSGADVLQLLQQIPELTLLPLPENDICCGGAGLYPLTEPEMARELRDAKIAHLRNLAPDVIVTSNLGCALQFRAGIRAAGLQIEVVHPVTLLAQRIDPPAASSVG